MPRETPQPTPLPREDDTQGRAYRCPYHSEIELLRRLEAAGIEPLVITAQRRDRLSTWLAGIALSAVLALGGGVLSQGWALAKAVGRSEVRLEQLERSDASAQPTREQLGRLEVRLEGVEQRIGDQIRQLERRLDSSERERPTQLRRQ